MTLSTDHRILMERYVPKEVRELLRENYIVYSVEVDVRKQMVHYTLSHGVSSNEYVRGTYFASTDYTNKEIFTESLLYLVNDFIYQIKRYHEDHEDQDWLPSSFQIKE